jgi:hypothetical protein
VAGSTEQLPWTAQLRAPLGDVPGHVADGAAVGNAADTAITTPDRRVPLALPLAVKLTVLTPLALQLKHDGRVAATCHDAGDAGAGVQTARLTIGWM